MLTVSPDFKRMSEKWTAIIQGAQTLDRNGVINWSELCQAFIASIDPNIAPSWKRTPKSLRIS